MARRPLPTGLTGNPSFPKSQSSLLNCFNNGEQPPLALPRPGIDLLNTTGKISRGSFVWRERLFQVVGESLIRVDTDGTFETISGTIVGTDSVEVSIGFNFATIVVKSATGKGYTLNASDVLAEITDPQFLPSVGVANLLGFTVFIPFDGSPAFYGDLGAPGTIAVTNFFDAEKLPDRNNGVFNLSDTLYITGTDSIELFRIPSTPNPTNPFVPVTGGRINNGFIGGLLEYGDTFLFIGREKDEGFGIYAIGQGKAPKISNEIIDDILNAHSEEELKLAVTGTIKVGGYLLATFTLNNDSFGFYKGGWFRLESIKDGERVPWGGGFIAQLEGKYFTSFEDKIGVFNPETNTDYGERVPRLIRMIFIQKEGGWFPCTRIELGISQGFNANKTTGKKNGTVALRTSRDGVLFGPDVYRDLGLEGDYQSRLIWRSIGRFHSFMAVEFFTDQDINFTVGYVEASIG